MLLTNRLQLRVMLVFAEELVGHPLSWARHVVDHELVDLTRRGSAADYLVDAARLHLEIGGRSRRRDLETAWEQKQPRLPERSPRGCYLCLSEFEAYTGRLAFRG